MKVKRRNSDLSGTAVFRWFADTNNAYDAISAISKIVIDLLEQTHQSYPPVSLGKIAGLRRVCRTVYQSSLRTRAHLQPTSRGFVIALQESTNWYNRREWWAHEIAHTFFYDISCSPPKRLFAWQTDEEEYLCDRFARELVIPASFLKDVAVSATPSLSELQRLCRLFRVRFSTMAYRLAVDLELWPAVFAVCEKKPSFIRGRGERGEALRVTQVIGPIRKGFFVPLNKTVETVDVFHDAFYLSRFSEGVADFQRFGDLRGSIRLEAMPLDPQSTPGRQILGMFDLRGKNQPEVIEKPKWNQMSLTSDGRHN